VLSVESSRIGAYSTQDLETLSVIAAEAAIAIDNARLYARSRESMRQMQALLHVAKTLNSALDLRSALEAILVSIRNVMPYAYASIMLPDHTEGVLDIMGSIGAREVTTSVVEDRSTTLKIPFGQGVSGLAFERGTAVIVPDVREFPGYLHHGLPGVFSELAMPLKQGARVIGVLDIGREGVNAFSPEDLDPLSLFASQAAIAIDNARLFSEQRERASELQAVQSIIQAIAPLHDMQTIAEHIATELKRLIDYWECRILTLDESRQLLTSLYVYPPDDGDHPLQIQVGEGFTGWIAAHGEPSVIPNILEDPRVLFLSDTGRREASMVGVPLKYEGRVRGVMTVSKLGRAQFDENSLRLLEIVGAQAAIAFDRARLYEQLRVDAITDPLVQLWNRRYLIESYKEERHRVLRSGQPLACLILDIDQFKQVNDRYGHDAGDRVLQEIGGLLRDHMRGEDIVARYGGEEFCVLLVNSSLTEARTTAERLRERVEQHRLSAAAGAAGITISVGVAAFAVDDRQFEMFSRADQAMYRAKAAGGNRVFVSEEEARPAAPVSSGTDSTASSATFGAAEGSH